MVTHFENKLILIKNVESPRHVERQSTFIYISEAAARKSEHLPHGRTAKAPYGRTAESKQVPRGRTAARQGGLSLSRLTESSTEKRALLPHGKSAARPCGRTAESKRRAAVRPLGNSRAAGFRSWISHSQKDPRGLWKSEHFCRSAKVPLDMSVTLLTDCRLHNGATTVRNLAV